LDQKKTGAFLKALRNEKGLTQEQFAEIVLVSSRTVSRWENGNNLPDLDILLQIADFYELDLRELLDGERKGEKMEQKVEEEVLQAVDYTNSKTARYTRRVHGLLWVGAMFWLLSRVLGLTSLAGNNILSAVADFSEGAACGMVLCGIVVTGRYRQNIKALKMALKERLSKR
jgi:transcriptional regulator with XRE-family HTH domain